MSAAEHDLYQEIRDTLVALAENGVLDADDPLLTQSFVEGETAIPEIIDAVLRSIDTDQALIDGLAGMIENYKIRQERLRGRIERKKGMIELALIRTNTKSVEIPGGTVTLRNDPRQLAEIDEAQIPSTFFTTPEPPKPKLDKAALLKALRAGEVVPGASLNNGSQSLQIRRA